MAVYIDAASVLINGEVPSGGGGAVQVPTPARVTSMTTPSVALVMCWPFFPTGKALTPMWMVMAPSAWRRVGHSVQLGPLRRHPVTPIRRDSTLRRRTGQPVRRFSFRLFRTALFFTKILN